VNTAIHGGSLQDNLAQGIADAVVTAGAAMGANEIGQWTSPGIDLVTGAVTPPALNRFAGEVAHAIVGCAAGAARTGNADGCAPGAVGAVAGHLAAGFINPTGDPTRAAETIAWSQVMSGVAGALVGTNGQSVYVAAGTGANAVENNRMLHPDERTMARRLAQQSGGRYTPEQIEAQMRLMGNKNYGVAADTLALWNVATQPGYNIDPGLPTQAVPGTTQVIETMVRPDWEIQQYITLSTTTGGGTNGVPPWTPYSTSRGGTTPINPTDVPTARFANGDHNSAAGLGYTQPAGSLVSPAMRQGIAGGAERLGRQAGAIGAAATAASTVPGPH
jgi:hypothetical protein